MTTISAKVIEDSIGVHGAPRLTTLLLRYPRFIHSEFMTHRVFSRNASSSRAIPLEKLILDIETDPAVPLYWGRNQKGMQAGAELSQEEIEAASAEWYGALGYAVAHARVLGTMGLHKQIVNRLLEPFAHISVLVTATEWTNFFDLRISDAAEPHMRHLAETIYESIYVSEPKPLQSWQWHLPFVDQNSMGTLSLHQMKAVSAARCARLSYQTRTGKPSDWEADLELGNRLLTEQHMSPFEHQASPDAPWAPDIPHDYQHAHQHGNFTGWIQWRKIIEQTKEYKLDA